MRQNKKATFVYASGFGFAGQSMASSLLAAGLRQRGWQIKIINPLIFNRVTARGQAQVLLAKVVVVWRMLAAWGKGVRAALSADLLYVNLGQTKFALFRDGFPLLVRRIFGRNGRAAIALHGSVFIGWEYHALEARLLRQMIQPARYITILGPTQHQKLVELGIPAEKIVQVDNTCLLPPITKQRCLDKQNLKPQQPLNILYLSNLIETKGYPEFVEAINQLASQANFAIDATLCGQIVAVDANSRFATHEMASIWLENQIAQINQSLLVRLRWINGADGKAKEELFQAAHVFVLPSYYKVEAQPIVIIEALASGCAVITTKVGEIPAMVSTQTALLLDDVTPAAVAKAIMDLHNNSDKRRQLALNGLNLFKDRFSYKNHIDSWENLLGELDD
jgi:glycosyltransferase involved in cell wall biosynthesis